MSSTTAAYTALSGMNANAQSINVIGNNIANSNTAGFKSSRVVFSSQFSRTISAGTPPGSTTGGTNPYQVGLGVQIAGTQANFKQGTISGTGDSRDLAIDGDGFFIVRQAETDLYTRAGSFQSNSTNDLVTPDGALVMGYGVDEDFQVNDGTLVPINIPVGTLTIAQATTNVRMSGNLNASGLVSGAGSRITIGGSSTAGLGLIAGANPPPAAGDVIETASLLTDIEDPQAAGSGTPLFTTGQVIELRGAEKGNRAIPTARLTIEDTSTVQDLLTFLSDALGLNVDAGANPDGAIPGVTIDPVTGIITMNGNTGGVNNLNVSSSDIRLLNSDGSFASSPLTATDLQNADGESVRTTMVVYDSLGTSLDVDLSMVLVNRDSDGTTWRYYVESPAVSDLNTAIATGTLVFGTDGQPLFETPVPVSLDLSGSGAETPMNFDIAFSGVTSLTDAGSAIAATYRDGSPIGTLTAYAVGTDGVITGTFTNGLTRTLGQLALATFANNEGLVDVGENRYRTGPNSGSPLVSVPLSLGAGQIVGGALEMSNVDLSEEFINLIQASTGYSASARVIQTTNDLMQQLLVIGR